MTRRFRAGTVLAAALAMGALACPAQSLRDLLNAKELPEQGFSAAELEETVTGADLSDARSVFVAYIKTRGAEGENAPHLARLDRETGKLARQTVKLAALEEPAAPLADGVADPKEKKKDECCSALTGMRFLGENLALTARYRSGTTAQVILSRALKPLRTILGQELYEVAPGEILSSRDGSHLAQVHADRLDWTSLNTGGGAQLFPLAGDRLRERFVALHARELPAKSSCPESDPCQAEIFDETIAFAGTDRAGSFAVVVSRLADHTAAGGGMQSQAGLYVFKAGAEGWRYCSAEIDGEEADGLEARTAREFRAIAARCVPNRAVEAVESGAQRAAGAEGSAGPAEPSGK